MKYVSSYFSPHRGARENVLGFIDKTKKNLDVAQYLITDDLIANKLIEAHQRGVRVRVVVEGSISHWTSSDDETLEDAGIILKRINFPSRAKMHNKYTISDGKAVMTGSYNWTKAAEEKNAENIVIVRIKYAVHEFRKNFEEIWQYGEA